MRVDRASVDASPVPSVDASVGASVDPSVGAFRGQHLRELPGVEGARIWLANLDQPDATVAQLSALLSDAEHERAAAQRTATARRRFVVGRATLRTLLREITGIAAERLEFAYGADGKPRLLAHEGIAATEFNISHARDVALIAVSSVHPVGIDIEWTDGSSPIDAVAARYFSAAERQALFAAPGTERRREFFRIWVRKEAYLKARGEGISQWIYETDFSLPHDDAAIMRCVPPGDQANWLVRDVDGLPSGFVASVAIAKGPA